MVNFVICFQYNLPKIQRTFPLQCLRHTQQSYGGRDAALSNFEDHGKTDGRPLMELKIFLALAFDTHPEDVSLSERQLMPRADTIRQHVGNVARNEVYKWK